MTELEEISAEIEEKKNEIISLGGEVTSSETTSTTTNQPISTMQAASTPTPPSTNVSDEYLLWINKDDGIPRLGRHAIVCYAYYCLLLSSILLINDVYIQGDRTILPGLKKSFF